MTGTLLIATHNPHKTGEMRAILADHFETITDLTALPGMTPPEETGTTFVENSAIKALAASRAMPEAFVLADDSGLEVDALEGRPGVRSARYGGAGLDDGARCRRLLDEIADRPDRGARFVCVLAFVDGDREVLARGVLEGVIARAPRGDAGFGYDPVFVPNGLGGRTFAEATVEEKNRISHRARAMTVLLDRLGAAPR